MMQNSFHVPPVIIAWLSKIEVQNFVIYVHKQKGLVEYMSKRIGFVA
jgi:hypothetical protein